jgi:hypothetical protein
MKNWEPRTIPQQWLKLNNRLLLPFSVHRTGLAGIIIVDPSAGDLGWRGTLPRPAKKNSCSLAVFLSLPLPKNSETPEAAAASGDAIWDFLAAEPDAPMDASRHYRRAWAYNEFPSTADAFTAADDILALAWGGSDALLTFAPISVYEYRDSHGLGLQMREELGAVFQVYPTLRKRR